MTNAHREPRDVRFRVRTDRVLDWLATATDPIGRPFADSIGLDDHDTFRGDGEDIHDRIQGLVERAQSDGVLFVSGHRLALWQVADEGFLLTVDPPAPPRLCSVHLAVNDLVPDRTSGTVAAVAVLMAVGQVANQLLDEQRQARGATGSMAPTAFPDMPLRRTQSSVDGRRLYFTATIVTLDGSDTNAHGEACEPGQGYTEATGWWSPDDESWSVHQDRDRARPDVYPTTADALPARWLADQLTERLGPIDHFDGVQTFYGADELVRASDMATPRSVPRGAIHDRPIGSLPGDSALTAAGHAHGFTSQEIGDAARLLGLAPKRESWPAHRLVEAGHGFVALHASSASDSMPAPSTTADESAHRGGRHR